MLYKQLHTDHLLFSGRSIHHSRRSRGHLHNNSTLVRESAFLSHTIPSTLLQARHQAAYTGTGEAEGGLQCEEQIESLTEGGTGSDRTGVRQPSRGAVTYQTSSAHTESIQRGM